VFLAFHSEQDIKLWFNVLNSSYYQQTYNPLFSLFCATRAANGNPQAIFDAQLKACAMLLCFQQERAECECEQNFVDVDFDSQRGLRKLYWI
jgi:hypothetical protein